MKKSRSSLNSSQAASATSKCPRCTGSKEPPNKPMRFKQKLQVPSSKFQISSKSQAPKTCTDELRSRWRLELGIYLELGAWNLELSCGSAATVGRTVILGLQRLLVRLRFILKAFHAEHSAGALLLGTVDVGLAGEFANERKAKRDQGDGARGPGFGDGVFWQPDRRRF